MTEMPNAVEHSVDGLRDDGNAPLSFLSRSAVHDESIDAQLRAQRGLVENCLQVARILVNFGKVR